MSDHPSFIFGPTNDDIVAEAVRVAAPKPGQVRGTFPRFMLIVDGEGTSRISSVASLNKHLSTVVQGARCTVFRNYGHGATIFVP